jgi:hypothetical protein
VCLCFMCLSACAPLQSSHIFAGLCAGGARSLPRNARPHPHQDEEGHAGRVLSTYGHTKRERERHAHRDTHQTHTSHTNAHPHPHQDEEGHAGRGLSTCGHVPRQAKRRTPRDAHQDTSRHQMHQSAPSFPSRSRWPWRASSEKLWTQHRGT